MKTKIVLWILILGLFSSLTFAYTRTIGDLTNSNNDNTGQYADDIYINASGYNITNVSFIDGGGDQHTDACLYNYSKILVACTDLTDIGSYLFGDGFNVEVEEGQTYYITGLRNGSSQRTRYLNPSSFPYYPTENPNLLWVPDSTALGQSFPPVPAEWSDSNFLMDLYSIGIINTTPLAGGGGDSTPPVINNITQIPANITVLNSLNDVYVNATITDDVALDVTSPFVNLTLYNISIYVNGALQPNNLQRYLTQYNESTFAFEIDENNFLPATYNINESLMELTEHQNNTLSGLQQFLKIEFYNITGSKQANFYEMYDTQETGQVDYYYCNSSYSTGNPVSSNYCTLFAVRDSNTAFNHTHSYSRHHILPMGINTTTEQINDVGITPVSYILIRGLVGGHTYYYINQSLRTSAELTTNNGNAWTPQTGITIDAHIHQFGGNNDEVLVYQICASDTSANVGCSAIQTDYLETFRLPPNAVEIYTPVEGVLYDDEIIINHSTSISPEGFTIDGYQYAYRTTGDYTILIDNNYPNRTYIWDITSFDDGNYTLRVRINDSESYFSYSYRDFEILNVYSLAELTAKYDGIEEEDNMQGLIYMWAIMTIGAIYLMINRNWVLGNIIWYVGYMLDFMMLAYLVTTYTAPSGNDFYTFAYGIFSLGLAVWLLIKFFVPMIINVKVKNKM